MAVWGETTRVVEEAAISALDGLNATPNEKKTGNEIYAKACQMQPDFANEINVGNFKGYLSSLSRNS